MKYLSSVFVLSIISGNISADENEQLQFVYTVERPSYSELSEIAKEAQFEDQLQSIPRVRPWLAVGLSYIVPGLGEAYLGQYQSACWTAGVGVASYGSLQFKEGVEYNIVTPSNVRDYSIYASYRDARKLLKGEGYLYPMPTDSFSDLVLAPFRLRVIKKPEVWGGLLGMLTLGYASNYFCKDRHSAAASSSYTPPFPPHAFAVGIAEESYFRGFIQPVCSEYFTPWGGVAASSLLFGAAHIPNAYYFYPDSSRGRREYYKTALPVITAAGFYFGWLAKKNNSLQEAVALHSWYDFLLFLASFSAAHTAVASCPTVSFSFSF